MKTAGEKATRITIHRGRERRSVVVAENPKLILPCVGDEVTLGGQTGWVVAKCEPTTILARIPYGKKQEARI